MSADNTRLDGKDIAAREIIANRLNFLTQESAQNMVKTAYSVLFAENRDFSCLVFDHNGDQVGLAEFVPTHQGGAVGSMEYVLEKWGLEGLNEGDVVMHNDALNEGSHVPDITLFKPIYYEGEMISIACCVAHHNDTGGMRPSSYCPDADEIYQEGIRFPAVKLIEEGEMQEDILDTYQTNVRTPERETGDLFAQLSTFEIIERGIEELCEKYGSDKLKREFEAIQNHANRRMKESIKENLEPGTYVGETYQDHDGWEAESWQIKVEATVQHEPEPKVTYDFAGTDDQAKGFVNSYYNNTRASVWSTTYTITDPYIHLCEGATRPIEMEAPEGTIVNANPPAPIGSCTTEVGMAIEEAIIQALGQARPENATGTWVGTFGSCRLFGSNPRYEDDPERLEPTWDSGFTDSGVGGGGARVDKDGIGPTTDLPGAGPITLPNVEIMETNFPVRYRYRRIYTNGGGPGEFRGSPGLEVLIQPEGESAKFTTLANKGYHGPKGFAGEGSGNTWQVEIRDPSTDETKEELPPKNVLEPLNSEDGVYMRTPGGGGYGDPLERDLEKVKEDIREGYIDAEEARESYGVVLDPATLEIDREATRELRSEKEPTE